MALKETAVCPKSKKLRKCADCGDVIGTMVCTLRINGALRQVNPVGTLYTSRSADHAAARQQTADSAIAEKGAD